MGEGAGHEGLLPAAAGFGPVDGGELMKVLMVMPGPLGRRGGPRPLVKLARLVRGRGVECALLSTAAPGGPGDPGPGVRVIRPGSRPLVSLEERASGMGMALSLVEEIKTTASMLRAHAPDFDVVCVHGFPATWAVRGLERPVVWLFDEPGETRDTLRRSLILRGLYGLGVRMDRLVVRGSVNAICVGDESNAERVMRRYGVEPRVIPYGVDLGELPGRRNEALRRRLGIEGRFVLMQQGMVSPAKNQMESLRAVKRLRGRIGKIVLLIAGFAGGAYRRRLEEYIRGNGLEGHVIFLGRVQGQDARDLYAASDVALFPECADTGWHHPLEVMASGATLVVSRAYAASALIAREGLGLVTDDMAAAVEYVFRNPSMGRRAAQRAHEWARRNFGWERFAGSMVEVFEGAMA